MLSGGNTLEQFAVAQATSVLRALAKRMPTLAHRRRGGDSRTSRSTDCHRRRDCRPASRDLSRRRRGGRGPRHDGRVVPHGRAVHDRRRGPARRVLSGAINGDASLAIRATRVAADSRYAHIMRVMQEAEQRRPTLRRIGDQLGAWYTPLALALAAAAWWWSGDAGPLSERGRRRDAVPAVHRDSGRDHRRDLGGRPPRHHRQGSRGAGAADAVPDDDPRQDRDADVRPAEPQRARMYAPPFTRATVLPLVAAVERHSRHPLAGAIVRGGRGGQVRAPGGRLDPRGARRGAARPASAGADVLHHEPGTRRASVRRCRPASRPASNASSS